MLKKQKNNLNIEQLQASFQTTDLNSKSKETWKHHDRDDALANDLEGDDSSEYVEEDAKPEADENVDKSSHG